ncbi:MAG: hypothetical protein PHQ35_03850 [Phycisphaerae bacterium]|nr:hypothetical protein [Phycisphaerae bacterium]MDD5380575.1 hypothetical protein [Phycisphaerae bacterium]
MKIFKNLLLLLTSLLLAQCDSVRKVDEMAKPRIEEQNPMEKFEFFLGDWNLEYKIPKSTLSEAMTGTGSGTFKRALKNKYVFFDYEGAHGIFAWDDKEKVYKYWWFEDSGNFTWAICNFVDDDTLFMDWQNEPMTQTFTRVGQDKIILRMSQSLGEDKSELVLEVILTRR